MVTPDGGKTLVIANDSDFGLAGIESDAPPFKLKPKTLANGRPDTGEFLVVDTTKTAAADPAEDGVGQGGLSHSRVGPPRGKSRAVVAWSGDTTS